MNNRNIGFRKGFSAVTAEHDFFKVEDIQGTIPNDLKGTLFRIGPGSDNVLGHKNGHWFDGDGMVSAWRFSDSGVYFSNKFVKTRKYQDELAAGEKLYSTPYTLAPGGILKNFAFLLRNGPSSVDNSAAVISYINDKLITTSDLGVPHVICPDTLETLGYYPFANQRKPSFYFGAHPKYNKLRNKTYTLGLNFISQARMLHISEIDAHDNYRIIGKIAKPSTMFVGHDMAMTDNYLIIAAAPAYTFRGKLGYLEGLLGLRPIIDVTRWDHRQPTTVHIYSLEKESFIHKHTIDPPYFYGHYINAYEDDDGIVFDYGSTKDYTFYRQCVDQYLKDDYLPISSDEQYYIHRTKVYSDGRFHDERLVSCPADLTSINPDRKQSTYRYLYGAALNEYTAWIGILKKDIQTGKEIIKDFGEGMYVSEPIAVKRKHDGTEDDLYILTLVYDSIKHTSFLAILDGKDIHKEFARCKLNFHVPFTFHGVYVGAVN